MTLTEAAITAYSTSKDACRSGVSTGADLVNSETAMSPAQAEKMNAHANVFIATTAITFTTGSILDHQ